MSNYTSIWNGVRSDKLEFVGRFGEFALKTRTWVQFWL